MEIFRSYFGLAGSPISLYYTHDQFKRELLMGLLFHGELVIPDTFWFTTPHFQDEILPSGRKSLFFNALGHGLLVPWFREIDTGSFKDALGILKRQGIHGMVSRADELALTLNEAAELADSENTYNYGKWPTTITGETFLKTVIRRLQQESPPIPSKESEDIWGKTKEWRIDCVNHAIREGTLRMTELFTFIGKKYYGFKEMKNKDVSSILMEKSKESGQEHLRSFLYWINQCYLYSGAVNFNLPGTVPSGNKIEQLGLYEPSELPVSEILPKDTIVSLFGDPKSFFLKTFDIPRIEDLLKVDPAELMKDITSAEKENFVKAYWDWSNDPCEEKMESLLKAMEIYSARLRKTYVDFRVDKLLLFINIKDRIPQTSALLKITFKFLEGIFLERKNPIPFTSTIISLPNLAWSFIQAYRPNIAQRIEHEIESLKQETLEKMFAANKLKELPLPIHRVTGSNSQVYQTQDKKE